MTVVYSCLLNDDASAACINMGNPVYSMRWHRDVYSLYTVVYNTIANTLLHVRFLLIVTLIFCDPDLHEQGMDRNSVLI